MSFINQIYTFLQRCGKVCQCQLLKHVLRVYLWLHEIVMATKSVVEDVLKKKVDPNSIDDSTISQKLLTYNCGGDPDILIRTSGEMRISNFLLWQLAYTELFFIDKPWPAIEKADLIQVIRAYVDGRNRRYGK